MDKIKKTNRMLGRYFKNIKAEQADDCVRLTGEADDYSSKVQAGLMVASSHLFSHVINKVAVKGYEEPEMRIPSLADSSLDGTEVDVLVIGGGVVGAAILRELSKYQLSALLVDKEEDLAMHASSRNDGCVHVGVDLHKGSKKLRYLQEARKIYPEICREIGVDYREDGQTIGFKSIWLKPAAYLYLKKKSRENKISGMSVLSRKKLLKIEPNLTEDIKFGVFLKTGACVCPYNFTIALAESAVINNAKVSLRTAVLGMEVKEHKIISVKTNRGTIYPKAVINAAGVFSDRIAEMADDQFFSIHPRKGTDTILDKAVTPILSRTGITIFGSDSLNKKNHSKGGGIIPTVDRNILVGPDAVEVPDREDFSTSLDSINQVFNKHKQTISALSEKDIITYFSGIRAATYEEDFIVQKGKWTENIIHAAGIQSPGLTAAPAIAVDVAKYASELLGNVPLKKDFDPIRRPIIATRFLDDEKRDQMIKINPAYGRIVCRCEEISEGEIIDCIHSVIPPTTIDGIKRRVRAGMGRCQGGFCQPLVMQILAREENIPLVEVNKKGEGRILFKNTKGE